VRTVLFVVVVALLLPAVARAKWQGDLRLCGASTCRTIERHLGHEQWPLLAALSTWPSSAGPPAPGPFYRLTIVPLDARGRPNLASPSQPIYFVPNTRLARNDDGRGGAFWTRLEQIPKPLAAAMRGVRPFPAPRLSRVIVGDRFAAAPQSYLRLFRLAAPRVRVRDPAGPRPSVEATTAESAAYWNRVERVYRLIRLQSRRDSPWSDWKTSLWIGRRVDLILRDGELVRIPHALAERIRRGESLR